MPNNEDESNVPLSWKPAYEMSPEELKQYQAEAKAIAEKPFGDMKPAELAQRKKEIMAKLPPFEGKLSDLMETSQFVTMSDEEIDEFIYKNLPGQAMMNHVGEGDEFAPRQYAMDMFPPPNDHQANRMAVEARLNQVLVLKPLQKEIAQVNAEIKELEQTPGIQPGDARLEAKRERLAELHQDLSQCELRLEANKEGMKRAARTNRVAPLSAVAKAEAEGLKDQKKTSKVKVNDKPEELREENMELYKLPRMIDASVLALEGLELDRRGYTPLATSPVAVAKAYKSEFKAPAIRPKTKSPEALPEELQGELQQELAQDAELNEMMGQVMGMMQPVLDDLNELQKQRADLSQQREQKKEEVVKQLAENPSRIEDAEVRTRAENARAALQDAEARIQECDSQLAALENLDAQAEAAAIQQFGSVENARTHYKNEKKDAVQKRGNAEGQLYSAVNAVVAPMIENDPEVLAINAQIEELKQQQLGLIQQYREEKTAEAQAIRAERKDHRFVAEGEVHDDLEIKPVEQVQGAMKESARVDQNAGTPLKLQEEELKRDIDQAPYQQYQSNVAMAAQDFKMNPEKIADPADRAKAIMLKQQVDDLKAKIARYDKQVEKIDQGKVGALLRSLASGGSEGRKEFYAKKKEAAEEQLGPIEQELDALAQGAVSVSMKQGLMDGIKPQVQQPRQDAVAPKVDVHANPAPAQNQPIQPDPEVLANAPNYPAPPTPELLANAPNYPAPPPPGQEMSKKPKVNIRAKAMDAGDGMPAAAKEDPASNNIIPDPEEQQAQQVNHTPLNAEEIDAAIAHHFPQNKVVEGEVPDYPEIGKIIQEKLHADGIQANSRDRLAIEARMVQQREIEPLQAQIAKAEAELEVLQETPGIEPGDERLEAKKAELNDLYEDLDNWEVRVEALEAAMAVDERKNRLAAINAEHAAEKEELGAGEKEAKIQFAEGGKEQDGNPRQEYELQVAAALTAKSLMTKMPDGGLSRQALREKIKESYGAAYQYEGPQRRKEDGSRQEIKGANDRRINEGEKDRLADLMQPLIEEVNELQAIITPLGDVKQKMYDEMHGDLRRDLDANPDKIVDPAAKKRVVDAKEALQAADDIIEHCKQRLLDLKEPNLLEQVKAKLQHGSVEKARAHYQSQQEAATKQRNNAKNSLNAALDGAALSNFNATPEVQVINAELQAAKAKQAKLLQDFHDQQQAEAAKIKPERVQGQDNTLNAQPGDLNAETDVRSALKKRDPSVKSEEVLNAESATHQKAETRQQRHDRLKPSVADSLHASHKADHGGHGLHAAKEPQSNSVHAPSI